MMEQVFRFFRSSLKKSREAGKTYQHVGKFGVRSA